MQTPTSPVNLAWAHAANAPLAGELGGGACRERRQLLVARLHEAQPVSQLVEASEDPVDAVAGIAVHTLDAPFGEALEDEPADGRRGHLASRGRGVGPRPTPRSHRAPARPVRRMTVTG